MKISELNQKSFLSGPNAVSKSYVLVNYEDDNTSKPVTYRASIDELGKAIANNLKLFKKDANGNAQTMTTNNGEYTNETSKQFLSSEDKTKINNALQANAFAAAFRDGVFHGYTDDRRPNNAPDLTGNFMFAVPRQDNGYNFYTIGACGGLEEIALNGGGAASISDLLTPEEDYIIRDSGSGYQLYDGAGTEGDSLTAAVYESPYVASQEEYYPILRGLDGTLLAYQTGGCTGYQTLDDLNGGSGNNLVYKVDMSGDIPCIYEIESDECIGTLADMTYLTPAGYTQAHPLLIGTCGPEILDPESSSDTSYSVIDPYELGVYIAPAGKVEHHGNMSDGTPISDTYYPYVMYDMSGCFPAFAIYSSTENGYVPLNVTEMLFELYYDNDYHYVNPVYYEAATNKLLAYVDHEYIEVPINNN